MTMLGRVRRRQSDDNPQLDTTRPFHTVRTAEYYKALSVDLECSRLE